MSPLRSLRNIPVAQRMAAIVVLVLLPMAVLSVISAVVLNDQDMAFRDSVEESVHALLPLTTLEQYLDRALVDELEAQSRESVPGFGALTRDIDQSFARIDRDQDDPDLMQGLVDHAQQAWASARPSVRRLIEQVHRSHRLGDDGNAGAGHARAELQRALHDVSVARRHLAAAVRARYQRAARARHAQLLALVWAWALTLAVAALLVAAFLRSLLQPIRELGHAARRLGRGDHDVRVTVTGHDELSVLAERFNDMAAHWADARRDLVEEAARDPLTGLLNRRGILALLDTQLSAHRRAQQPLSVFMMDLDHFKAINDEFGHSAGDRALVWVSARIAEHLRESDRLGRYGGDEFLAVLPSTGAEQARDIAARLTGTIASAAARDRARPGVGIGVASAPDDGWDAGSLIDRADAALYAHKQRRHGGADVTAIRRD